ncbi:N-myc-interactor [Ascaphus truei]|uniref:N-myc-interactor n=1 Tax=Ascaphus truei TaxID=8439 RepID=UPI003F5A54AC
MGDLHRLKEECEAWKEKCDREDNRKTTLLIQKLDADENKIKEKELVTKLGEEEKANEEDLSEKEQLYKREVNELMNKNSELEKEIQELEERLDAKVATFTKHSEQLQIGKKLPENNINFTAIELMKDNAKNDTPLDISCKSVVTINGAFVLQNGQALLTFEDEEVAQRVIKKSSYTLNFNGAPFLEVRAGPVHLQQTLKFEVNTCISTKKVIVRNLPLGLCDEYLKDKLELTFYKSKIGGGEIENVECDQINNSAHITFLKTGVVGHLTKRRTHEFIANGHAHEVTVEPFIECNLNKLQLCSGISTRTVLLTGIKEAQEAEEDIQDQIEIYFQKPSNGGGEVEAVAYCLKRKRVAHFEEDLNSME